MPRRTKPSREFRLTRNDYRDRELLFIIDEEADDEGLVTSEDIARRLKFIDDDGRPVTAPVAQRFSHMVHRYGQLRRVEPRKSGHPVRWGITDWGRTMMRGRLARAVVRELDREDPGTELLLMREVSHRAMVKGDRRSSNAVRREFQYSEARRRR